MVDYNFKSNSKKIEIGTDFFSELKFFESIRNEK